ncbi:hypothetical protein H2200_003743 [Cladophialophora chaetospira]|uniref:Lipid droplet-associated hydrolase n=1 Tax=Cladophialophora chaetospira TaxID=386627 RepID=A0AA38XF05_9EURO|nr:hypothetical protein H2200_003743 [Cladophialophora chaetospira]
MRRLKSRVSANVFLHVPWTTRSSGTNNEVQADAEAHPEDGDEGSRDDYNGAQNPRNAQVPSTEGTFSRESKTGLKGKPKSRAKLVFFVTGNPGLIAYYHPFLSLLVRDLQKKGARDVVVAGMSLGGFDVEEDDGSRGKRGGEEEPLNPGPDVDSNDSQDDEDSQEWNEAELLYPAVFEQATGTEKFPTLQQQIELSYTRLDSLVGRIWIDMHMFEEGGDEPIDVVLMGHSVGAYICLELVRLWHERHPQESKPPQHVTIRDPRPLWAPSTCVLLTPTIQDIHLSPSGRLATPLLTHLFFLPALAHLLVHTVLLRTLPTTWLAALVSRVTGMQSNDHGLKATLAFLKSERGVKEALFMAGLEMQEIRKDRWGEEIWGASNTESLMGQDAGVKTSSPGLFFWFAEEDHWVADATKEAILRSRASGTIIERNCIDEGIEVQDIGEMEGAQIKSRPPSEGQEIPSSKVRLFETKGLVHAWCLNQSEFVARHVSKWLVSAWTENS